MAQHWDLPPFSVKRQDPLVVVDVSKDIDFSVWLQKEIRKLPFECGGATRWIKCHRVLPLAMKRGFNCFTTPLVAMMNYNKTAQESIPRVPKVEYDPKIQEYSVAFEKLYDLRSLTRIVESVDKDVRDTSGEYRRMMHAYDEALHARIGKVHNGKDLILVPEIPPEYAVYFEHANAEIDAPSKMWESKSSVVDSHMKQLEHYTKRMELGEFTPNEFVGVVRGEQFLFTRKFQRYFNGIRCNVGTYVQMIEDIERDHDVPEFRGLIVAMEMVLNELKDVKLRFSGGSSDNVSIPIAVIDDIEKRVSQNVAIFKKHELELIDHMKDVARSCDRVKLTVFFANERHNVDAVSWNDSGNKASILFPDVRRYVATSSFDLRMKLVRERAGDKVLALVEESHKAKH